MKIRNIVLLLSLVGLCLAGCSKKSGGGVKLRSDVDSVAYVIGMNVGLNLYEKDSTLNVQALCEGIRDVFREKTKLSTEEAKIYLLSYLTYSLPEKARAFEEQFLSDFARANRSYARTSSGVTYAVESVGNQELIPTATRDTVYLRVVVRTVDEQVRYSSYERGDSVKMAVGDLPVGLRESVKLVGEGGKIDAWVPSSAAYGAEGNEQYGAKPNETLRFEMELVKVDKYFSRRAQQRVNF